MFEGRTRRVLIFLNHFKIHDLTSHVLTYDMFILQFALGLVYKKTIKFVLKFICSD